MEPHCTEDERRRGLVLILDAAAQRHPSALMKVGLFLIAPSTTETEEDEAIVYIRESAKLGHTPAQTFIGTHILSRAEVLQDRDDGFLWLGEAASDGSALAARTLAEIFPRGVNGIAQDECAAELWFEAAFLISHDDEIGNDYECAACR